MVPAQHYRIDGHASDSSVGGGGGSYDGVDVLKVFGERVGKVLETRIIWIYYPASEERRSGSPSNVVQWWFGLLFRLLIGYFGLR